MFDQKYMPFVVGATLLMTSQPILTTLSKVNGHYQYVQISTTLLAEFTKLALSAVLYVRLPRAQRTHDQLTIAQLVLFAVPGLIYFINNNLIFVILMYVNSTTYQILSSLKTVFTGILFRVLLKRKLTDLQMLAIVLLACGTATSQVARAPLSPRATLSTRHPLHMPPLSNSRLGKDHAVRAHSSRARAPTVLLTSASPPPHLRLTSASPPPHLRLTSAY